MDAPVGSESQSRVPEMTWGVAAAILPVFLAVLVLLGGERRPRTVCHMGRTKAVADVVSITGAVEYFALQNGGRLPAGLEDLVRPDEDGFSYLDCSAMPPDPWGNPYRYELSADPPGFLVLSLGADGLPGGDGEDADVSNLTLGEGAR